MPAQYGYEKAGTAFASYSGKGYGAPPNGSKTAFDLKSSEGGYVRNIKNRYMAPVLLTMFVFTLASIGQAQDENKASTIQVPAGQKMDVTGAILSQQPDGITVRSSGGAVYNVVIAKYTETKEKKNNPFRSAKKYSKTDLVPGLQVEVKGIGDSSGSIAAREIRMRNDDLIVAQTMDTRVVPVENRLKDTQTRLSETEQNAQRLSGQVQELSAISNAARGGAKAAQETADNAMSAANDARSRADNARAGVQAANERIGALDDYSVKNATTVHFKIGSAVLSNEDKSELQKFAEQVKAEKGFVIEVAGFASSDGDEAYNRRLSQRRADAVIQYLAETYSIPLRRFITPMGYGESQPVADNRTLAGRKENRRVEVRMLVSKGLLAPAEGSSNSGMERSTTSQLQ
jgi:outer membrane protein OmpA-like peptidoglycan-associated protein